MTNVQLLYAMQFACLLRPLAPSTTSWSPSLPEGGIGFSRRCRCAALCICMPTCRQSCGLCEQLFCFLPETDDRTGPAQIVLHLRRPFSVGLSSRPSPAGKGDREALDEENILRWPRVTNMQLPYAMQFAYLLRPLAPSTTSWSPSLPEGGIGFNRRCRCAALCICMQTCRQSCGLCEQLSCFLPETDDRMGPAQIVLHLRRPFSVGLSSRPSPAGKGDREALDEENILRWPRVTNMQLPYAMQFAYLLRPLAPSTTSWSPSLPEGGIGFNRRRWCAALCICMPTCRRSCGLCKRMFPCLPDKGSVTVANVYYRCRMCDSLLSCIASHDTASDKAQAKTGTRSCDAFLASFFASRRTPIRPEYHKK